MSVCILWTLEAKSKKGIHVIASLYNTVLTSQLPGDTLGFLLHKAVYLMENPVHKVNKMSMFNRDLQNHPNTFLLTHQLLCWP